MNLNSLLTDAKFPENLVQNVFDIDAPQQTPERVRRRPQLFSHQLFALPGDCQAAAQGVAGFVEQSPLPLTANQTVLARPKIVLRKRSERADQFRDAVALARGDPEHFF